MLIVIPKADRSYHRGMSLFGRRGLGDLVTDPLTGVTYDDSTQTIMPTLGDLMAEGGNVQAPIPSYSSISDSTLSPVPPNVAGGISPANIGVPSPTLPGGATLNAAGVAVAKPGYTVNAQGQIVPASSLSGIGTSLSNFFTANKNLLLVGGLGIVGLSLLGGKKRRR